MRQLYWEKFTNPFPQMVRIDYPRGLLQMARELRGKNIVLVLVISQFDSERNLRLKYISIIVDNLEPLSVT